MEKNTKYKIILETKRLILREFVAEDFSELYIILSDRETMKYYSSAFDEAKVRRWINWSLENYQKYGFGLWVVILKENGRFIGDCGITMQNINGQIKPEIGYHIKKEYQRQGYATEAAQACRDYGFNNTSFDALYTYMNYTNTPSAKVAINNGMSLIEKYPDPENEYDLVYRITRTEWENMVMQK